MTIFSSLKHRDPGPPETCTRCRARLGTTRLDIFRPADAAPADVDARRLWLCDPCRDALQRDSAGN